MERPVIAFLTDFGPDGYAAICRGVMIGIARDVQIVDVGHSVRKYAIADGAYLLESALPYLPICTVVGVVDPGVGTERRPVGLRTSRGDVLIGPDNGLLLFAADAVGGIAEARLLENRELMLPATSSTFHGRDIFSPFAAHLATGVPFERVGRAIDPATLVRLPAPPLEIGDGELRTAVIFVDGFGNVRFGARPADLARAIGELTPGRRIAVSFEAGGGPPVADETTWQQTFGTVPPGRSLLFEDSLGRVSLADNQANVAARLGVDVGRSARLRAVAA